jgi:hypothetical protein
MEEFQALTPINSCINNNLTKPLAIFVKVLIFYIKHLSLMDLTPPILTVCTELTSNA